MTNDGAPRVKDPVSPAHKRFVLSQARLRIALMAAIVVALAVWLVLEL